MKGWKPEVGGYADRLLVEKEYWQWQAVIGPVVVAVERRTQASPYSSKWRCPVYRPCRGGCGEAHAGEPLQLQVVSCISTTNTVANFHGV